MKFNETVLFLISRNQQDIEALKEEVNKLQKLIENMNLNNKNKDNLEMSKDKEKDSFSNVQIEEIHKGYFKCNLCSYQCEKKISLKKHTNTEHGLQTNISDKENKFYCDKCSKTFTSKKRLKTHKHISHELINCDKCESTFKQEKELMEHMKEQHHIDNDCKCTSDSVCDQCIDSCVQKGHQEEYKR